VVKTHNVNVNGNVIEIKRTNYNNNYNDNVERYDRARQVEFIADKMLEKLGADKSSRPFMCKVAWKLSESRIWQHIETVCNEKNHVRNKVKFFIYLCKKDGV